MGTDGGREHGGVVWGEESGSWFLAKAKHQVDNYWRASYRLFNLSTLPCSSSFFILSVCKGKTRLFLLLQAPPGLRYPCLHHGGINIRVSFGSGLKDLALGLTMLSGENSKVFYQKCLPFRRQQRFWGSKHKKQKPPSEVEILEMLHRCISI